MENETVEKKIDFEKVEEAARRGARLPKPPTKPLTEDVVNDVVNDAARRGARLPAEPPKKAGG